MKLLIERHHERSGFLTETNKFTVVAQIELDEEERDLISKYSLHNEAVYSFHREGDFLEKAMSDGEPIVAKWTISDLIEGKGIYCDDVAGILIIEEQIKGACETLKEILSRMALFGQKEIIEF